jgi:hypothetical protein
VYLHKQQQGKRAISLVEQGGGYEYFKDTSRTFAAGTLKFAWTAIPWLPVVWPVLAQ